MSAVKGHKTEKLGVEVELNFADSAMAMFGDKELGDMGFFVIVIILFVIIWTVKEHDKVSILLDGA